MTARELFEKMYAQGATPDTEVVMYHKSETYEIEVFLSLEDGRVYLMEK